jgi:hypothetical protein
MKKGQEKDPLEEQLQNIIRKKSEENEALNKLLEKLSDSEVDSEKGGAKEENE